MRLFLSLFTVAILIAVAAFAPKAIRNRDRTHEDRLLGALKVIERTIEASSDEVHRIGLFAPKIAPGLAADSWLLEGVVTSVDVVGEQTYARFDADLKQKCAALLDAVCWQIDRLAVGTATLVRGGQRAGSIGDAASASAPAGDSGGDVGTAADASAAPEPPADSLAPAPPVPPVQVTATVAPATGTVTQAPVESTSVTASIQSRLQELGYNPGPADGMMGPRTVSAILAYQRRNGLQMDGLASNELLDHLQVRTRP